MVKNGIPFNEVIEILLSTTIYNNVGKIKELALA